MLRAMTTYPLSDEDREIQARARGFVEDDLIPWEQHAEEHGGEIPDEEKATHTQKAKDLGLFAMNMPVELGGTGMTTLQQVLVSEQIGRVTNALGWVVHTPPAWAPVRGQRPSDGHLDPAHDPRRDARVLRHHRGGGRLRR